MLMVKGNRIQSDHFAILVKLKKIIKEIEIQKSDEDFDNAFADIFGVTKSLFTNFINSQRQQNSEQMLQK
jgi:hypothetical protein